MLGTTKEYVGCPEFDHHNAQLEQAPNESVAGAPKVAGKAYQPPRRQTQSEVTQHCERYNLNPAVKQQRAKATEWYKKKHCAE
jgi:leucyl aminopeptidase (aminopeptidase T)